MHLSASFGTRIRGAFFVGVMAASFGLAALPARAATPAESFVSVNIQKGLTILGNRTLPQAEKSARFREFLTALTDIRRIALFTLGPVKRTASPADLDAFVDAFRDFAVAVYESRLSAYSGQT